MPEFTTATLSVSSLRLVERRQCQEWVNWPEPSLWIAGLEEKTGQVTIGKYLLKNPIKTRTEATKHTNEPATTTAFSTTPLSQLATAFTTTKLPATTTDFTTTH